MIRAALYARFSTDLQSEASIDDQLRQCERTAEAAGFEVSHRFEDRGISGGTADRPGYQALLLAARSGAFDVIITEDLSRLWRSRAEFGPRSAELEDLGVHLVTCSGDDTRREGWGLMTSIKAAMAEHYRREISYRTRRGMEGLAVSGKPTGGRCYGYGPGEGEVVRRIFAEAAEGRSPAQIARWLDRDGIPGPRGPRWSLNAVKRILANPRYAGRLVWGQTQRRVRASDGRRQRPVMQSQALVDRAAPELQLVDDLTWSRVQELQHYVKSTDATP